MVTISSRDLGIVLMAAMMADRVACDGRVFKTLLGSFLEVAVEVQKEKAKDEASNA